MTEKRYRLRPEAKHKYWHVPEAPISKLLRQVGDPLTDKECAEKWPEDWEVVEVETEPFNEGTPFKFMVSTPPPTDKQESVFRTLTKFEI